MEKEDELNFMSACEVYEPLSPSTTTENNEEEEEGKLLSSSMIVGNNEEEEVKVADELSSLATGMHRTSIGSRRLTKFGNLTINDHFTLSNPSSNVTFQEDQVVIFVDNLEQVVLEKKADNDYVTVSQTSVSSPALIFLRAVGTLVAALMAGFLFVFCVQLILFLFLGLTIQSGMGAREHKYQPFSFTGTLLAMPIVIRSLSQIMAIATAFVYDTWRGSKFAKTIFHWKSTKIDWIHFLVFIGIPLFIAAILLCSGEGDWWAITSISWFFLVFVSYNVFATSVIFNEIYGCLKFIKRHPELRNNDPPNLREHNLQTFLRAIQLRTKQKLSGHKYVTYISHGADPHPDKISLDEMCEKDSCKVSLDLLGKLSQVRVIRNMYKTLGMPLRQYFPENVLKSTPYFTDHSWGLESIYCHDRASRYIAIIDGQGALRKRQTISNIVCYFLGTFLTFFITVSILVWFDLPAIQVVIVVLLCIALLYQPVKKSLELYRTYRSILSENGGNYHINRQKASDAIYQVHETFRITEPRPQVCWILFGLEVVFFFIIPATTLLSSKNYNVGIVFICLGIIYLLRDVCNAPACVRELGHLEGLEDDDKDQNALSVWRKKNRLGKIISDISVGKKTNIWSWIFVFFTFLSVLVLVSAFVLGTDDGHNEGIQFASKDEFVYTGSSALNYASCTLGQNLKSPEGYDKNYLADFAFMSSIAYLDDDTAANDLKTWFGNIAAENLVENVSEFKKTYHTENSEGPVQYKLFNFPDQKLQIIAVRGTANPWDALADLQLWSSAALAQYVRAILPLGMWWTGILSHIVKAISVIEDRSLKEVSYYRETTAFVKSLKSMNGTEYNNTLQIVGHSLGGGIAMITGAQTGITSVALSGPNNMISRRTFLPPITIEALNKYTFNIVPDSDPIPRIDDLAHNYQRIECRAPPNDPLGCHSSFRSLCELLYTCGSNGRPIPCFCVDYGYEEPKSLNGKVFSEACSSQ